MALSEGAREDEWKTGARCEAMGAGMGLNCREWQSGKLSGRGGNRRGEECLLRGRNKTMPFLERCRRFTAVLLPLLRKEKEAEWLLETDSPD